MNKDFIKENGLSLAAFGFAGISILGFAVAGYESKKINRKLLEELEDTDDQLKAMIKDRNELRSKLRVAEVARDEQELYANEYEELLGLKERMGSRFPTFILEAVADGLAAVEELNAYIPGYDECMAGRIAEARESVADVRNQISDYAEAFVKGEDHLSAVPKAFAGLDKILEESGPESLSVEIKVEEPAPPKKLRFWERGGKGGK